MTAMVAVPGARRSKSAAEKVPMRPKNDRPFLAASSPSFSESPTNQTS